MNAAEAFAALERSGSGKSKLVKARVVVQQNPDCPASEVVQALLDCGASGETVRKFQDILNGARVDEKGKVHREAMTGSLNLVDEYGDTQAPRFPVRAPIGGCTIGRTHYEAGAIIGAEALSSATASEIQVLTQPSSTLEVRKIEDTKPALLEALKADKAKFEAAAEKNSAELEEMDLAKAKSK